MQFFLGDFEGTAGGTGSIPATNLPTTLLAQAGSAETRRQLQALLPVLRENQVELRRFGLQLAGRLTELQASRALGWVRSRVAATA